MYLAMNPSIRPTRCHQRVLPFTRAFTAPVCARASSQKLAIRHVRRSQTSRHVRQRVVVVRSAMFDNLGKGLEKAWGLLKKDGTLTSENLKEPLREVRRALLEADVSLPVVRRFVKKVEESALGMQVTQGVTPMQQFVKVVSDELVELMGSAGSKALNAGEPQVILMAGLQGVGKTTACGKLALYFLRENKKVLMVATDVYRPAAIDQLVKLGESIGVPVFEMGQATSPVEIAAEGVKKGKAEGYDAVIIDTAGRLQVDENMMTELKDTKAAVSPTDTLLVVDAMTGQEAANLTRSFNEQVNITGAILTKMDGDSRGGAALSVREVSGAPIKFVGTGEKLEALEPFYPERMAQRILGMGDMLTLYERASSVVKEEEAVAQMKKIAENKFDYDDFLKQMKQMSGLGGMASMMKLLPGMNKISEKQIYQAEKEFSKYEAMIASMTAQERSDPDLVAASLGRRRRVAEGSGYSEGDVNQMVAKFAQMRVQMQTMAKMMRMGGTGGKMDDEQMMKELLSSSTRKVAPGKVRRKKAVTAKTKGFSAV